MGFIKGIPVSLDDVSVALEFLVIKGGVIKVIIANLLIVAKPVGLKR